MTWFGSAGIFMTAITIALLALAVLAGALGIRKFKRQADSAQDRLRRIIDNVPGLVADIDAGERYRFVNLAYEQWFGVDRAQIVGRTIREILGENAYAGVKPAIERAKAGEFVGIERVAVRDGRQRHLHLRHVPQKSRDGTPSGFFLLGVDISEQKSLETDLRYRAEHDVLTRVPNRALFLGRFSQALKHRRRNGPLLAVIYLDIDHFKSINDTHGHAAGDELLKAFVGRIAKCLRTSDIVARLGGDEFVILADGLTTADDAGCIAEKIIAAMRAPFAIGGTAIAATTSIGIAIASTTETDSSAVLARADAALYKAKSKGRNTFHVD